MIGLRRWYPEQAPKMNWKAEDLMELILDIRDTANNRKRLVGGAGKRRLMADLAEIAILADHIFWRRERPELQDIDVIRKHGEQARRVYEK